MHKQNLKWALHTILDNEETTRMLFLAYDLEQISAKKQEIIQKAVNEIYSDKLLEFVNQNMQTLYPYYVNDEAFFEMMSSHHKSIFPMLAKDACLVGAIVHSDTAGSNDFYELEADELYILENGTILTVYHSQLKWNDEVHFLRKTDKIINDLSVLAEAGFIPDHLHNYLID